MTNSVQRQPKKTRLWVLIADRIADYTITVGGILIIAAVMAIMVFLVWEVLPLFQGGSVVSQAEYTIQSKQSPPLSLCTDEYKSIAATVHMDGTVSTWHAKTGKPLQVASFDLGGKTVTAASRAIDGLHQAFGFSDGTVRFCTLEFKTEVFSEDALPANLEKISAIDRTDGAAVFSVVPGKQIRKVSVHLEVEDEIVVSERGSPILSLDYRYSYFAERPRKILVTVDANHVTGLAITESRRNLLTQKVVSRTVKSDLPPLPESAVPRFALVNDMADQAYFAEQSGKVYRYNTRNPQQPVLAETINLTPKGVPLTVFRYLIGDQSLVVGGADGSVNIFFRLPRPDAETADGFTLVKTRTFEPHKAAVSGFDASLRGKSFATADAEGQIMVRQGTNEATLLRLKHARGMHALSAIALTPRLDGFLAIGKDGRTDFWDLSIPHAETSYRALFGKIWYEGYPEPSYTWQSTGATEAFEPKLSLVPLIFGTLKATFYSLMFAVPLALLAAIYTSEFLPHRVRATVKPVMEVMASIPSVVLGFVAALVLSPVVETWIAAVILAFVGLPACLILASYAWQLLPPSWSLRLEGIPKLLTTCVVVSVGLYMSFILGPLFESVFFGGSFAHWVNGTTGSAIPFTFLMVLPLVAALVSLTLSSLYGRRFHMYVRLLPMPFAAVVDFVRWLGVAAITVAGAYFAASCFDFLGFDPRTNLVGTYVQRNTLVVGFAMGFAVIPIIYTLAEDALNSVPEHLRSASLACGATPWQTAMWVILPTAISGVFSAMMIGMGRAVGETMIVVMAAGNTPLMDINIFDGLRALSANIAVELPEAPKDATLYRVLFLTALVLFGMTFVINTVAELVRLRFRKRAMTL
jgi:phosphate transport system permease protein